MSKRLLIIASNTIHTYNYIHLIKDYFDDVLLLTNSKNEKSDINSIIVDFRLGFNILLSCQKIKKIVKEYKPSIVHIHQANSYAFISALALRDSLIPKVLTAWGSDILINPKKNLVLKKMLQYSLNKMNIVTSDSLYMAKEITIYSNDLDVRIANFGIDKQDRNTKKENIIYSNRLHKSLYNIDKVIYSFLEFSKNNPDWKLVIGAIGEETKKLTLLVERLGLEDRVEFIGWVDSTVNNEFYQKAKIYISIPSSDATAISLLEAISNDCICFVSNLPANSEHILDGINGFIEPNLDKIDLEKYHQIDNDILKSVNNIKKESYLKSTNRRKFLDIYDELLGGDNK